MVADNRWRNAKLLRRTAKRSYICHGLKNRHPGKMIDHGPIISNTETKITTTVRGSGLSDDQTARNGCAHHKPKDLPMPKMISVACIDTSRIADPERGMAAHDDAFGQNATTTQVLHLRFTRSMCCLIEFMRIFACPRLSLWFCSSRRLREEAPKAPFRPPVWPPS